MSNAANIPHPLQREGTYQSERHPAALKDDYIKLDERSTEDLLEQSAAFARFVRYYNEQHIEDGNWEIFFSEVYDYNNNKLKISSIAELEATSSTSPHLALFITFLKLLGNAQEHLNGITKRHLDFYYKTILQLKPRAEQEDNVAVLFEPEKNVAQVKVPSGTILPAGKDATGKDIFFKTTDELIVNKAKIASIKTLLLKKDNNNVYKMYKADDATTENIVESESEIKSWIPFGITNNTATTIGFAVSSPLLNLPEGKRRVTLGFTGIDQLDRSVLKAEYTSPKGWIEAEVDILPGIDSTIGDSLSYLLIKMDAGKPAMSPYTEAVHLSGYNTTHPAIRLTLNTNNETLFNSGYTIFKNVNTSSVKLTVTVSGVRNLILQNDGGLIDPAKPFFPFGAIPVKHKSTLYVGCYEAFNKYLKSFHLAINWKGIPGNLYKYYQGWELDISKGAEFLEQWQNNKDASQVFTQGHPPGKVSILDDGHWKTVVLNKNANYRKEGKADTNNTYKPDNGVLISDYEYGQPKLYGVNHKTGFAKIELKFDFGHKQYPQLLTQRIKDESATIPNPPYTPEFQSIHLDYVAETTIDNTEHCLYHIHPFGHEQLAGSSKLVPSYTDEGQMMIGLSGVTSSQVVSLFFLLHNDTGNPDKEVNDDNKITWSYLSGNSWQKLETENIIRNTTLNFTATGFIKFNIPQAAVSKHTILTDGLVWLKAGVVQDSDAYPYVIGIETQATEAVYDNRGNDPERLKTVIAAGTITKMQQKIIGIKKVIQPYASYNGRAEETGERFYTRISERLRHKGRSWNVWDYERMILEQFPAIYKAKCIPHTTPATEYAPGSLLLVLLPNPDNINFQDKLQPRVSKSTIQSVKSFLAKYVSAFANIEVNSPQYEPLQIVCDVKIRPEYGDESYYSNELKKELTTFIAPWSNNSDNKISFEGKIYKSQIINFIEERPYIDYVTSFEVYKYNSNIACDEMITADKENIILTSAASEKHIVNTIAKC